MYELKELYIGFNHYKHSSSYFSYNIPLSNPGVKFLGIYYLVNK